MPQPRSAENISLIALCIAPSFLLSLFPLGMNSLSFSPVAGWLSLSL